MAVKLPETEVGLQMAGCPVDDQLPVGKERIINGWMSDDCQLPVGKGKDYKWLGVQWESSFLRELEDYKFSQYRTNFQNIHNCPMSRSSFHKVSVPQPSLTAKHSCPSWWK